MSQTPKKDLRDEEDLPEFMNFLKKKARAVCFISRGQRVNIEDYKAEISDKLKNPAPKKNSDTIIYYLYIISSLRWTTTLYFWSRSLLTASFTSLDK